jgi:lipopolysaccharide transport system permease protein
VVAALGGHGLTAEGRKPAAPMGTVTDILDSRDVLRNLLLRELKSSYKGSVLGFMWSLLNPLVTMAIFTVVFSVVLQVQLPPNAQGVRSFPAFLLVGLLPWSLISLSMSAGATSLVANGNLIRKVYFFRVTLPASVVLANAVNFLVGMGLLLVFLVVLGVDFWSSIWLLPVPLLALLMLSLGLALLTSVANLYYRDIQYLVGLVTMAWFYATPIIYPLGFVERVGEPWLTLYRLNPATALIETFRAILYDGRLPGAQDLLWSLGTALAVLAVGWLVFRRAEPHFAEEV